MERHGPEGAAPRAKVGVRLLNRRVAHAPNTSTEHASEMRRKVASDSRSNLLLG